ncbi:riboflavin kinase [Xylographa soralifera]|nr:riboflavin kinase [Xylographa soralifera]
MPPSTPRPLTTGPPSGPEAPFPLKLSGKVVKGFGRGSAELGIPTANIPIAGLTVGGHADLASGVYYGFAGLNVTPEGELVNTNPSTSTTTTNAPALQEPPPTVPSTSPSPSVPTPPPQPTPTSTMHTYPTVLSIGYNPFYKNTVRSVEVHVLHSFPRDFYGAHMNLLILGFVRPELDYVSKEALIADIHTDMEVARRSLAREGYAVWRGDGYLRGGGKGGDVGR